MVDGLASLEGLSPSLTPAELLVRLGDVLQFAITNLDGLDRFAPFWQEEQTPSEKENPSLVTQADKVIVETALLVLLASRVLAPADPESKLLDSLTLKLMASARTERNQVLFLRFPHTAASLGIAHVILSHMGHRDERFDGLVRDALASGYADALERLPYRAMDLRWLLGILNPHETPNFDDLLRHSILTSCANPIYESELDVYAVTHAVMYLTDFGSHVLPSSLHPSQVGAMVDSCLAWHILSGNLDLLGELLMSAASIGNHWSPYVRLAWRQLTSVSDEFGFVPSSTFHATRFSSLSGDEASAYAFLHTYHTTYVAGLLYAVLLRHPATSARARVWEAVPPTAPSLVDRAHLAFLAAQDFCSNSGNGDSAAVVERNVSSNDSWNQPLPERSTLERVTSLISNYPGPCGRAEASWTKAITHMECDHSSDLALVLSDALIIQAARDYNLPVLVAALLDRANSALPVSPTLVDALTFLTRQQLSSGAIGAHFVVPENCKSSEARNITQAIANCIAQLILYVSNAEERRPPVAFASA